MTPRVGILHPGEMGTYVARTLRAGYDVGEEKVYWCSEGRSAATRQRAALAELEEVPSFTTFCSTCELIFSVCPPHAAGNLARRVIQAGFKGLLVDANAISPQAVIAMGTELATHGIKFVDGGIIGLPGGKPGDATLYLSGPAAEDVAACFKTGPLLAKVLGPTIGQASALKMCYAAWNKGRNALLTSVLAAAEHLDVREALQQQWDQDNPGFSDDVEARLRFVARKAWRFSGEMQEIAATLRECGLPGEFFDAAAELYQREAAFKDAASTPDLAEILAAVLNSK
jgi:3-hydroxyisobutyrate dehydrogenase-like beta-hydroxyacid dehydrogenase